LYDICDYFSGKYKDYGLLKCDTRVVWCMYTNVSAKYAAYVLLFYLEDE